MTDLKDRNVVLVILDTVTAFHMSCYGYEKDTTPFLDMLADENTFFSFAYSNAPWTVPSHASIFSGQLPKDHETNSDDLHFSTNSFVEDLSEQGKNTFGFTANGLIGRKLGFDIGFDEYLVEKEIVLEHKYGAENYEAWKKIHSKEHNSDRQKFKDFFKTAVRNKEFRSIKDGFRQLFDRFRDKRGRGFYSENRGAEDIRKLVEKKMERNAFGDEFFLFLNFMEAHELDAPRNYVEKFDGYKQAMEAKKETDMSVGNKVPEEVKDKIVSLYDAQIRYLDDKLKQLYQQVTEKYPDAVFIITSDHGENLGHYKGIWGHQYGIWERSIRVPLIVAGDEIPDQELEQNVSLRKLSHLLKGEKELEELGSEEVFAEYNGAKGIHVDFRGNEWENYSERKKTFLKNRSEAIVKDSKGLAENSELEDDSFNTDRNSYSEAESLEESEIEEMRKELRTKYSDDVGDIDF